MIPGMSFALDAALRRRHYHARDDLSLAAHKNESDLELTNKIGPVRSRSFDLTESTRSDTSSYVWGEHQSEIADLFLFKQLQEDFPSSKRRSTTTSLTRLETLAPSSESLGDPEKKENVSYFSSRSSSISSSWSDSPPANSPFVFPWPSFTPQDPQSNPFWPGPAMKTTKRKTVSWATRSQKAAGKKQEAGKESLEKITAAFSTSLQIETKRPHSSSALSWSSHLSRAMIGVREDPSNEAELLLAWRAVRVFDELTPDEAQELDTLERTIREPLGPRRRAPTPSTIFLRTDDPVHAAAFGEGDPSTLWDQALDGSIETKTPDSG